MNRDRFVRYAWAALGFNVLVIVWGAFVRASGSGAGCGAHWPLCNGEIVPRSPRMETLVELGHRVSSAGALIAVALLAFFAFRTFPKGHAARAGAVLSCVFILGEALIGAAIVLLGKVAKDTSLMRAPSSGAHLVNTFFLVSALAFTAWSGAQARAPKYTRHAGIAWALGGTYVLLVLAGSTGAVAALGDTLWPATSLTEGMKQDIAANAHLFLRIRALHPLFAVLSGVMALATASIASAVRPSRGVTRAALGVRVAVLVQIGAGVLNLLLLAPIGMQLVHVVLADAVVVALVILGAESLCSDAFGEVVAATTLMEEAAGE